MFEKMEISEQVYEEKSPSKKYIRVDDNYDSHVRKQKGGEAVSSVNPNKGLSSKRKTINAVSPSKRTTSAEKNAC